MNRVYQQMYRVVVSGRRQQWIVSLPRLWPECCYPGIDCNTECDQCWMSTAEHCQLIANKQTHTTYEDIVHDFEEISCLNAMMTFAGENIIYKTLPVYNDLTYNLPAVDPVRPNPRLVSNRVLSGPSGLASHRNRTTLFAYFGTLTHFVDDVVNAK